MTSVFSVRDDGSIIETLDADATLSCGIEQQANIVASWTGEIALTVETGEPV